VPPRKKKTDDDGDRIKKLIYSPPNAGKTVFCGTAALDERTAPVMVLDFEGGLKSIRGLPGEGTDWIPVRCFDWDDFSNAYERVRVNDEGFKSVTLDSLSEVHNYAIEAILVQMEDRRKEENKDMVEQGDYGKALIQMRRLVREFRDLPIHFFCTAHSKDYTDPREGLLNIPNLYGKAAFEIPGLLETVGYLAIMQDDDGNDYRSMLYRGYPKVRTKVRTPWGVEAPEEIDNPTVSKVLDALGYNY
jgi:AAA domain